MYDLDFTPLIVAPLMLAAFFAVAAIFGWVPALWAAAGMVAVVVIRKGGKR